MTRRRRTLLAAGLLAILGLGIGGFAWYWHATAVHREVRALLDQVRKEEPGRVQRWFIKLGLRKDLRTDRNYHDVAIDLAELGPLAGPELIRSLQDSEWRVQCTAALAIGRLGDRRAVEPLISVLKESEDPTEVFRAGCERILWRDGPKCVSSLD